MTKQPGDPFKMSEGLSASTVNPLWAMGGALTKKAFLLPIAALLLVTVALLQVSLHPGRDSANFAVNVMSLSVAIGSMWLIYHLCGKRVPWWWLLLSSLTTMGLFLYTPVFHYFAVFFRETLPGNGVPRNATFPQIFVNEFFGAGLCEECFKAIPVLVGVWIGIRGSSPWKERLGVREPLDGILLGAASGIGFLLIETVGQYGPSTFNKWALLKGEQVGALAEIGLVIPRLLKVIAGHAAYTGYLGYFIGLAVMRPTYAWKAILYGLIPAAGVHALWNSSGDTVWAMVAVTVLAYSGLAAAILQARKISPTRADNFASTFSEIGNAATATVAGGFSMQVGGERYPLHYGVRLREAQIAGIFSGAGDGFVAEVSHNPNDPKILGIKNLSSTAWQYVNPAGKEVALPAGKSAKLVRGARIRFGAIDGAIE